MTRAELLRDIRDDRATLDDLVAGIERERLLATELDEGWSVKDVLAHITGWEQLCLKWIREGRREEGPFTAKSIDVFNGALYDAHSGDSLDGVLAESRKSYAELLSMVESFAGDLDAQPPWAGDEATDGRPAATFDETIRANSNEHYGEHIKQIRVWLARTA